MFGVQVPEPLSLSRSNRSHSPEATVFLKKQREAIIERKRTEWERAHGQILLILYLMLTDSKAQEIGELPAELCSIQDDKSILLADPKAYTPQEMQFLGAMFCNTAYAKTICQQFDAANREHINQFEQRIRDAKKAEEVVVY